MSDFYENYDKFKTYSTPELQEKHIRQFDREFWNPGNCTPDHSVLEIGCGTGQFLLYLHKKGVNSFVGIDANKKLASYIPKQVTDNFKHVDVEEFLNSSENGQSFDRIIMFDVLEHFTAEEGSNLLIRLKKSLRPNGLIFLRLPNLSSPWGGNYQFGDLTHKAAYTPSSIRQLALSSGYDCLKCFGQVTGSKKRRILDKFYHKLLSAILMTPPDIWSANFLAILRPLETDI